MATLGTQSIGGLIPISSDWNTVLVSNAIYEVHGQFGQALTPQQQAQAITALHSELPKRGFRLHYAEISDSTLTVQLSTTQPNITTSSLIAFLPEILTILGFAVAIVAIFLLAQQAPIPFILLVAGGVLFFGGRWVSKHLIVLLRKAIL